jgi:RNA polymerase subunit RPABC4/transcription elongation factor Spt4
MGMNINVYAGPILRTESTYKKQIGMPTCPNIRCSNYQELTNYKFCPECGSEVVFEKKYIDADADLSKIAKESGLDTDFIYSLPYNNHVFIPNEFREEENCWYGEGDFDLTYVDIRLEIEKFKTHPSIEKLLNYCKENGISVKVSFEVISFWS